MERLDVLNKIVLSHPIEGFDDLKKLAAMQCECAEIVEPYINKESMSLIRKIAAADSIEVLAEALAAADRLDSENFHSGWKMKGSTAVATTMCNATGFGIGWYCLAAKYGNNFVNSHRLRTNETEVTDGLLDVATKHFSENRQL